MQIIAKNLVKIKLRGYVSLFLIFIFHFFGPILNRRSPKLKDLFVTQWHLIAPIAHIFNYT